MISADRLELVVQADATEGVGVLKAEAAAATRVGSSACRGAKVDVEGFNADGPVVEEGIFKAAASSPASFPVICGYITGKGPNDVSLVLYMPVGKAAGGIKQCAIERIADAATDGAKAV